VVLYIEIYAMKKTLIPLGTLIPKVRKKTRVPTLPTSIQEMKGIQIGKEILKLSLFINDMIFYLKDLTKKLLNTINSFSKVAAYKINLQKSVAFLHTNNEQIEKEYRKTIPFTIASKKIKYLGINLTKNVNAFYQEN
jgi:hypothetical protein